MTQRSKNTVVLCVAVLLLVAAPAAGADYRTYLIRPTINNDAILEGEALPAVCLHISTDGGANWDEGTIIDYPPPISTGR